jgi:hypothetical protein
MRVVPARFREGCNPVREINDGGEIDHEMILLNHVQQVGFFTHELEPPFFQLGHGGCVRYPLATLVACEQYARFFKNFAHGREPEVQRQMDGGEMRHVSNQRRIAVRIIRASTGENIGTRHKTARAMPLQQ